MGRRLPLKFPRRLIEDFDLLRGVHGDTLKRFAGLSGRNEDTVLQIDGRLALDVIGVPRHETDLATDTHEQ